MNKHKELESVVVATAQNAVDFKSFDPLPLERAVAAYLQNYREKCPNGKRWQAARVFHQTTRGAFGHLICTKALINGPDTIPTQQPTSGLDALQQFRQATQSLYGEPAAQITQLANTSDHPLFAVGRFLVRQGQTLKAIEANPAFDSFREGSRGNSGHSEAKMELSPEYLADPLITNAEVETENLLILRALVHTLTNNGEVPSPEELSSSICPEIVPLTTTSTVTAAHLRQWRNGSIGRQHIHEQLKKNASRPTGEIFESLSKFKWNYILEHFLQYGEHSGFDLGPVDGLLLQPKLAMPDVRKFGRCAALSLRPRLPSEQIVVRDYFSEHGSPVETDAVFSASKFLLVHGLGTATRTIFANDQYREALAAGADYIMRHQR